MYLQLVVEAERVERVELRFLHHNHPNVTTEQQEIHFKNNFLKIEIRPHLIMLARNSNL